MTSKTLKPKEEPLEIKGRLTYCESLRAWSIARFKPPLIRKFSQLKNRSARYNYRIKLCWDFKELNKEINKIKKNNEAVPILLHFEKV